MKIPFLDLKRQYAALREELEPKILECFRSSMYINGPYVSGFETSMSEYLGVNHVIGCANGTDAIVLALRACNVQPGDEVITTPFTFFASAEAIGAIGAVPVFVDIREDDLNMDPKKIETAITDKTKVIMPVHIFGHPAPMYEIMAIAKRHGLKVVEDAAQGIGASYKGKKVGGIGDITTFSFYPTKNLGACGDGGMITTNDDEIAVTLRALCEHGAGKNGALAHNYIYGTQEHLKEDSSGDTLYDPYKYYNYLIGYNSRLDAIQAVVLKVKLKYLDVYNSRRTKIAAYYNDNIKGCKTPDTMADCVPCWHQYVILTPKKHEIVEHLAKSDIGGSTFYPIPLHLQRVFDGLGYKEGDFPVAEKTCAQSVCLPIFPELTGEEMAHVVKTINDFLG